MNTQDLVYNQLLFLKLGYVLRSLGIKGSYYLLYHSRTKISLFMTKMNKVRTDAT